MSRIPYPKSAADATTDSTGRPLLNVQKILGHLPPGILNGFEVLGKALLWEGTLPPDLREIAIVRVGHFFKAKYELHHHVAFARAVGVPEEKLAALATPNPGSALSAVEAAAVALVDELVEAARPSDAALQKARAHLNDGQLLELVVVTGYYMMVCRILGTTGIEIDDFALGTDKPKT